MAKCNIDIRGTPLAACQAGFSVARKWRWALKGPAAHIHSCREPWRKPLHSDLKDSHKGHL